MNNSFLYRFIINAANIAFLQVDRDSESLAKAECSPSVTTNSNPCSDDLDATSLQVDRRVRPVLMKLHVSLSLLKSLETLCYPSVQLWCWIISSGVEIPKYCDGFIMADRVQMLSIFEKLSSAKLEAFVSRKIFQSCNAACALLPYWSLIRSTSPFKA